MESKSPMKLPVLTSPLISSYQTPFQSYLGSSLPSYQSSYLGSQSLQSGIESSSISPPEFSNLRISPTNYNELPISKNYTINDANNAAENGDIVTLNNLIKINIFPNNNALIIASENGYLSVLDTFIKNKTPYNIKEIDVKVANGAARNGHLYILKFLADYDIFPDIIGANDAAKNGYIDILNWLSKYDIFPNSKGATDAYNNDEDKIIRWLYDRNIFPLK